MNRSTETPNRSRIALTLACLALGAGEAAAQGSWMFAPAAFTHDPRTGGRTTQFASHEPVDPLPDPAQTVSRYWRTRTNLRGADGGSDTIYEVRSFGNSLGGFDAQRERGYDAQLETLAALRPFRNNPYVFLGGLQGYGYGFPGYPAAVPGTPTPQTNGWRPPLALPGQPIEEPCNGPDCGATGASPQPQPGVPQPGLPGTAWPYAPPSPFVPPVTFFGPYGGLGWGPFGGGYGGGPYGGGFPGGPGHGYGPGFGPGFGPGLGPGFSPGFGYGGGRPPYGYPGFGYNHPRWRRGY